jgi:cytochrome c551/c552
MIKRIFLILNGCIMLLVALLPGCISYNGEELFQTEGCITCHRFKGKGGNMGPDLTAITQIKSDSSIESYLKDPMQIIAYLKK